MKKYISLFRIRFLMGIQYRAAALAGIATQFMWGFMLIMIYHAFYQTDAAAFPMTMQATVSYIWMQQAFLAMFMPWLTENEIMETIRNGDIAYELCRPISVYKMWFGKEMANRLSRAILRCMPILLAGFILPVPYGIAVPTGVGTFLFFLLALMLGFLVLVSLSTLIYVMQLFLLSPQGLQAICVSVIDFCSGGIIPIPFFPDNIKRVLEILPFGSLQNVPLRVYSGDLAGREMFRAIVVQLIWLLVLTALGEILCRIALRKVRVQGG